MENSPSVDQKLHRVWKLLEQDHFRHGGSVVAGWRTVGERRLGPYYKLCWRETGRQRSVYLGRSAELADQVRVKLAELQADRHEALQWKALHHDLLAELRDSKRLLERQLQARGLQLKGWELRGWSQQGEEHGA